MEEAFNKLQKNSKNTVDNLIKWMKNSKLIDGKKVTEEKARQLFNDVADAKNVELSKFKEVVVKLATEQKLNVETFMKTLADEGPKLLEGAVSAAASAAVGVLKGAFKSK